LCISLFQEDELRIQRQRIGLLNVALASILLPISAHASILEYTSSTAAGIGNAPDSNWSSNVAIDQSPNKILFIGGKQDSGTYGVAGSINAGEPVSTLTLTGMPAFTSGTISLTFYAIQSWDGWSGGASDAPDIFNIEMNGTNPAANSGRIVFATGTKLFSNDFSQVPGTDQDYPSPQGSAATNGPDTGSIATNALGYTYYGDATYQLTETFAAGPGGTLTFEFYKDGLGDQIASDESFGLNNVSVSLTPAPIPEPASLSLLALLALTQTTRRRRGSDDHSRIAPTVQC
jgi:hypothetical protein